MSEAQPTGPETSSVPIVIHVGLHKTGTTWLQTNVFEKHAGDAFVYSGDRALLRGTFANPDCQSFDPATARQRLRPLIDRASDSGKPLVLSDEMLAGISFNDYFRREVTLRRIRRTFPEAHILITVREQVRIIYSIYGNYLRVGYSSSLDQFLAVPPDDQRLTRRPVLERSHYDYHALLVWCRDLFGHDAVTMVPMEWMIAEPQAFSDLMTLRTGVDWPRIDAADTRQVVNPAWSGLALKVLRHLNRFSNVDSRWQNPRAASRSNMVAHRVSRWTPKSTADRMRERALATIRKAVADDYPASNRRLAEATGIDLEKYGYMI